MKMIFWASLIMIVYPYFIYPIAVFMLGLLRPREVRRSANLPTVTILIPAYNEVACIGKTIQNKLDQGYPGDKLEIIVISDGSTDGTDQVVNSFADQGVILLRREGRAGKAAALNDAMRRASNDIIVFSDANTVFGADALHRIVENFADPEVGYITGSLGFGANSLNVSGAGVAAYIRYENMVRKIESRAGSIIGVNGGVDAIRRELYKDIPANLITDFILPLTVMAGGSRVVFDASVTAYEAANTTITSEFRMRVRVALRALQGLVYMRRLFNPLKHPLTCFCLISHKVLRYLGFIFMLGAMCSNIILANSENFYQFMLTLQMSFYVVALLGLARWSLPDWFRKVSHVPSYLLLSNTAFAVAAFRFLRGDSMAVWQPRAG